MTTPTRPHRGPRQRQAIGDIQALKDLIADRGQPAVERELDVHRTTILRWLQGTVKINQAKAAHIRMLLGHLPGTDESWQGWRFWRGKLCCANGDSYTAEEIARFRYLEGLLYSANMRVARLERELAEAQGRATSANDVDAKPLALVQKAV